MAQQTGLITKATGGFYYVTLPSGDIVECRARGIFRKENRSPRVGDQVEISISGEDGSGTVMEILPRKNTLVRPPLSNLDYMVVVLSVTDPAPNLYVTDKYLAVLEYKEIPPILAVTKADLKAPEPLADLYRTVGFPVYVLSSGTGEGVEAFTGALAGKLCAFSGNSGVGKSTLLNSIDPRLGLEVGDTSKKLGRGRHTTRHVELFTLENGAMVADTPGFSTVELLQMSDVEKESLPYCFREFVPFLGDCRFTDCCHIGEKDCAVCAAVEEGKIAASRYQSYLQMYNEIKDVKEWEKK